MRGEVGNVRVSFAKVMAILAFVGVGVASGTSFLADAPQAIAAITSLLGRDKEAEMKEAQRLGRPSVVPALPAPQTSSGFNRSLEDEIPF